VAFLVLIALLALLAILTAMEMATFSARPERMAQASELGDRRGTMVKVYQRSPSDYLSAIQLIATAANFIVGAMIGANIEHPIREYFAQVMPTLPARSTVSWIVSVGLMTIFALIFTNVLPKHIGFVQANEIAIKTAPIMRLWIKISWPVTSLIRKSTKVLSRMLKIAPSEKYRVTEKDIDSLLLEGLREGSLDPTEQAMMRRAIKLSDTCVDRVMVPREQVLWLDVKSSKKAIEAFFRKHLRSNFLVCDGALDKVVGVVRVQDWFVNRDLDEVMTKPVYATPSASLLEAIELLRPADTRLLVIQSGDEIQGVLTLNDVMGAIVGPIRQT
jgi:putative hemolysin